MGRDIKIMVVGDTRCVYKSAVATFSRSLSAASSNSISGCGFKANV